MKNNILPTIIITILFIGCVTTKPPAGPSKKMISQADKIYLVVNEKNSEAYLNFANYLMDAGFDFSKTDATLLKLQTNWGSYRDYQNFRYYVDASVRSDSTTVICISGKGKNSSNAKYEVRNSGSNASPIVKYAWDALTELAKGYPHKEIYYGRN